MSATRTTLSFTAARCTPGSGGCHGPAADLDPVRARCLEAPELYQDVLLEEPPTASAPAEIRQRHAALVRRAAARCGTCPLLEPCLYAAVVEHDVAGFVAGSSQRQRSEIRRRLAVTVEPEDFDTLAGVARRHRQVDHDEVVRLRRANPQESLETLAQRLGCSLSTVKRHLRSERAAPSVTGTQPPATPSSGQVLAVWRELSRRCATPERAAA